MRKVLVAFLLFLMLAISVSYVKPASSQSQAPLQTIFIQPDGSIYPATDAIQRDGNTYIFTSNLYAAIDIFRSNIVLNGAGYTLSGPYNGTASDVFVIGQGPNQLPQGQKVDYVIGVDLGNSNVCGVTIENLNIENFSIGTYMWTQNNTVKGNNVSDNIVGMLLSGSNNTIISNVISNNTQGLFFGFNKPGQTPSNIIVCQNSFLQNSVQISGCKCQTYNMSEPPHNWDNEREGNYWSDYASKYPNATQIGNSKIGDTTYWIDPLDRDRYPLMQNPVQPPIPTPSATAIPVETIVLVALAVFATAAIVYAVRRTRK
jgi:parallel beta-helix repeat protein